MNKDKKYVKIDVSHCARCEQDHKQLEFEQLTKPMGEITHWGMCPITKQPIMMRFVEFPVVTIENKPKIPENKRTKDKKCNVCGNDSFWFNRTIEGTCESMHNVCYRCGWTVPCGDPLCDYLDKQRKLKEGCANPVPIQNNEPIIAKSNRRKKALRQLNISYQIREKEWLRNQRRIIALNKIIDNQRCTIIALGEKE